MFGDSAGDMHMVSSASADWACKVGSETSEASGGGPMGYQERGAGGEGGERGGVSVIGSAPTPRNASGPMGSQGDGGTCILWLETGQRTSWGQTAWGGIVRVPQQVGE